VEPGLAIEVALPLISCGEARDTVSKLLEYLVSAADSRHVSRSGRSIPTGRTVGEVRTTAAD
jgi:hypothetical protein